MTLQRRLRLAGLALSVSQTVAFHLDAAVSAPFQCAPFPALRGGR